MQIILATSEISRNAYGPYDTAQAAQADLAGLAAEFERCNPQANKFNEDPSLFIYNGGLNILEAIDVQPAAQAGRGRSGCRLGQHLLQQHAVQPSDGHHRLTHHEARTHILGPGLAGLGRLRRDGGQAGAGHVGAVRPAEVPAPPVRLSALLAPKVVLQTGDHDCVVLRTRTDSRGREWRLLKLPGGESMVCCGDDQVWRERDGGHGSLAAWVGQMPSDRKEGEDAPR